MINRRLLNIIRVYIEIAISLYIFITYYKAFYIIIMSAVKYVFGLNVNKYIINIIKNNMESMFYYTTTIFNMIKPDINLEIDSSYWEYLIAIVSGIFLSIISLICCAICRLYNRLYITKFRLSTIRPTPNIPPRWLRD